MMTDGNATPLSDAAVRQITDALLQALGAALPFAGDADPAFEQSFEQPPDAEPAPPAPPPPVQWFYSPGTGGFYRTDLSREIPGDGVEITEAEHRALIEGQADGREIKPGADGRPELRNAPPPDLASRRVELAALRYQRQSGGITVGGITVPTDRESASNITAAVVSLTQGLLTAPIKWKMTSGWVDLSQAQIVGVGAAVAQHVQRCFEAEAKVSDDLAKNLTIDIVAAFDAAYAALSA